MIARPSRSRPAPLIRNLGPYAKPYYEPILLAWSLRRFFLFPNLATIPINGPDKVNGPEFRVRETSDCSLISCTIDAVIVLKYGQSHVSQRGVRWNAWRFLG
jgi:hypothetical protein